MKNRLYWLIAFWGVVATSTWAQTDSRNSLDNIVGIRVGGAISYVTSFGVKSSSVIGYSVGVVDQLKLVKNAPFYLEAGLSLMGKGYEIKGYDDSKTSMHFLQVPVGVNYHIPVSGSFRIIPLVGGYMAISVAGEREYKGETVNVFKDESMSRFDCGAQFGLSASLKNFQIGACFNLGLKKIDNEDNVYANQQNLLGYRDLKSRSLVINIGYNF